MFDKDISLTGKHGDYMRRLVAEFDDKKNKFFRYAYDVYKCAAVIGFLYGRKAEKSTSGEKDYTIFLSQINNIYDDLMFNYRLIMLLDEKHESNFDERLAKAFSYYGDDEKNKSDRELFERYTFGGIEVLYEKLIGNASKQEDYLLNLMNFIQDFNQRYNSEVNGENLIELCRRMSE